MDLTMIADDATKAVASAFAKEAVGEVVSVGKAVLHWLRGKPGGEAAAAKLEAKPDSLAARSAVRTAVLEILEDDPSQVANLHALLSATTTYAEQRAKGTNIVQIQGIGNVTSRD